MNSFESTPSSPFSPPYTPSLHDPFEFSTPNPDVDDANSAFANPSSPTSSRGSVSGSSDDYDEGHPSAFGSADSPAWDPTRPSLVSGAPGPLAFASIQKASTAIQMSVDFDGTGGAGLGLRGLGGASSGVTEAHSASVRSPPVLSLTSPKHTFDPFAPLDPSPTSRANPYFARGAAPPSPESESPRDKTRPRPLFIPMPETREEGLSSSGSGDTPTWPFNSNASGARYLNLVPVSPLPVTTPSQIHASFGDPDLNPHIHANIREVPSANPIRTKRSIESISNIHERRTSVVSPFGQLDPNDKADRRASLFPDQFTQSEKDKRRISQIAPRHGPSYSNGTHSLLSSRQPWQTRFAAQLDSPAAWLVLYFGFNLGLTLYNKLVLQGFPFAWTLTGIQMLAGTIGTQIALSRGYFVKSHLSTREELIMLAFSFLYTINIAVSNLSLHLVSVPFHQVVRATTPLFTILLSAIFLRKRSSHATLLSLVPVVLGVAFATWGDYNWTSWGLILTLLGTLLAALKTIVTNRVQVGRLKLHPLDLLIRMSPLAFVQCVAFAWWSGELEKVAEYSATKMTRSKAMALAMNGVIAFGLNVVSFTANKKTSALTMTVAANVKQVLTIVLAVIIFNLSLNAMNLFGITLTLAGGAWYAKVELAEKSQRVATSPPPEVIAMGETRLS